MVRCVSSHLKCKTEWGAPVAIRSAAFSGPEASFPVSWPDSSLSTLLSYLFPMAPIFASALLFELLLFYSPVQLNFFFL